MQLVRQVLPARKSWLLGKLAAATGVMTWVYLLATEPRRFSCHWDMSKAEIARMTVHVLAHEAFPAWRAGGRGPLCPPSIDSLIPYTDRHDLRDPYGVDYVLLCDPQSGGYLVLSAGDDGKWGTPDDVRSDQ